MQGLWFELPVLYHGVTTTTSSRQGYFQLKQDSLGVIFDLFRLESHTNPTHLPMAAWIHSSASSFLSSTVRLKLSPVVPFTDDKEMLAHTEPTCALSTHRSQASTLQFFAHPFLVSIVTPLPPLVSCSDYFSARKKSLGVRLCRL